MKKYLLPNDGNFYKANLHTHTTFSDGSLTPEEIKRRYMEKGYSVVAYTDYQYMIPHNELTDENFLALTGVEYAVNKGSYDFLPSTHLNYIAKDKNCCVFPGFHESRLWGAIMHMKSYLNEEMKNYEDSLVPSYSDEFFNELIEKLNEKEFLVTFNHPNGSLQNFKDYGKIKGLWGIECHNSGATAEGFDETIFPLVDLHREGERVFPIAADDTHGEKELFGGFSMIKAKNLDYDTIYDALKRGDFYSSEGPEIKELYVENGIVHIKTSPVKKIFLFSMQRFDRRLYADDGKTVCEVEFDINSFIESCENNKKLLPHGNYIRIEAVDEKSKHAYTRCYYRNEFLTEK